MRTPPPRDLASFRLRSVFALLLCSAGAALGFIAITGHPAPTSKRAPRLAIEKPLSATPRLTSMDSAPAGETASVNPDGVVNPITFGHPIISGIQGVGFEQDLRLDPSNASRLYTSAPGTLSANTSWIWRSLDTGRTFKWIPNATALEGKVTTCNGGGDTELAVDIAGHLYFCDLTLANFSTARSDDFGSTFTCSNSGVPDAVVDRQWYTIDGDPTNGGSIYLANDEIGPGGVMCSGSVGNNVLVMYRSPAAGAGPSAGIMFGPANHVSGLATCDEAIMGNNEVSPVATTLGQPNGAGGYATLPTPVKHVFVVHDNAALNKILIGRCFPVAFGAAVPNVSDPSGLNCVDLTVADLGANTKTGGDFPTMAIDRAGNLYAVWEQAPINAGGMINGDTVLMYSSSTDQGNTWAAPVQIPTGGSPAGTLHTNVFAWLAAGDDGRVDVAWYGTPGAPTFPSNGPDSCPATCEWSLWMAQTLNGHAAIPTFSAPVRASEHFSHRGSIQTLLGGQNGDRSLGDFLQLRMGALGEAEISYADSNNIAEAFAPHGTFVRQNGGSSLLAAAPIVNISGLAPMNSAADPTGDGKYEANGMSSANIPQLDIIGSRITKTTSAPCSVAAPCYQVVMQLNNLSLAPAVPQDPDPDLVWSTQWLVPSTTDVNGGKNFHVYAESLNGAALQCFVGENAATLVGGGVALTYPGATALPAANCQSVLGANGTITIYVPLTAVTEAGAIDNRLHEVTASTMTLQQPANTVPSNGGIGGSLFNLIDVAQGYTFDPAQPTMLKAVSRKTHATAGDFDIDLPQNGPSGIECRSGGASGVYQVLVTFVNNITAVAGATVTSGTASVINATASGSTVTVNLTGVGNAQALTLTLNGVNDGTVTGDVSVAMRVLIGDTNGDGTVNSGDATETRARSGQITTAGNFRSDVNTDGVVNSGDATIVRARSGTTVP
ncbi:MAG: dockerin type I domain-containing protein [Verrucomicrobiota bacterium]|nr:dockerin type I domain-containing protein [Verrucomicrobiota bacterium]